MSLFDALEFEWDRDSVPREVPRASTERALFRFRRMLPQYVWDAGVLEGNPFTFPEVKTLLEGVTVGGRKLSDHEQILNLAESARALVEVVKDRQFLLDKPTFCSLHALVARNEALEWGHFRGEGVETQLTPDVALGKRGYFTPSPTQPGAAKLNEMFVSATRALHQEVGNPFERAAVFFLFGSLQQFFFDGNKRTSRLMMNGVLMSEGIDAISIPAIRAAAFNSRMADFYTSRDATEMIAFVLDCHPEIARIRQLNPGLPAVHDVPSVEYHTLGPATNQSDFQAHPDAGPQRQSSPQQTPELSLEETQSRAAKTWQRSQHSKRANELKPEKSSSHAAEQADKEKPQLKKGLGLDIDSES